MTSGITQQQLEFYLWGAKQKAPGAGQSSLTSPVAEIRGSMVVGRAYRLR